MSRGSVVIIRNAAATDFGGGERFPVFLAKELKKLEHRVLIVSRSAKLLEFAKDNQIQIVSGWWWNKQNWSGKHALLFPLYTLWQVVLYFYYLALFFRVQPSVIHIQSKDDFVAATFAARTLGLHVIWTDHADLKHIWQGIRVWNKNPTGKLVYIASKFAQAITVVSKSELLLVTQNLSPTSPVLKKLHVVYNGTVETGNEIVSKPHKTLVYTIASRLVTDKGIREAIEAFNRLSDKYAGVELQILGDGPEARKFKKLASANPHILFLGHKKDPLTHIANADVFVHPTHHEGFSVALVEASMLARPIIATDVGGNPEIIKHMKTGLLVPIKDSASLYKAMEDLYNDPALRTKLGNAARLQYEQRFNFTKIVKDEFLPLYGVGEK